MAAAVGHQADVAEREQDVGIVGHHREVGGEGERRAHPGGGAVHRGDDGLRHVHDGFDHRVEAAQEPFLGSLPARLPIDQVGARREALALARQHDDAHLRIVADLPQRGPELIDQRLIEGVAGLRAVEADRGDALIALDEEVFEIHRGSPGLSGVSARTLAFGSLGV